jgi:LacI family transcriptional regulator
MRRPKRGVTIVDIARKLDLSPMTVSRALTGNTEISGKTRERVLRAAAAMGYRPNRWARSLVTRRSSMVGVVIPDISHSFFAEITFGVEEALEKANYDIMLCHSRGDAQRERAEVAALVSSGVDGLIIASVQPENQPEALAAELGPGVPVVLVDRYFPKAQHASVRVDDFETGRLATSHLIELGHERVAHIAGPALSPASERKRGYLAAIRKAKLPYKQIVSGNFEIAGGQEAMARLLAGPEPPTAVFAANDPMGIGAVYACRAAGLRIPDDISIVGAGNIEGPHHPNPFLTTVDWPREELGRTAAEILLELIGEREPAETVKVFAPRLLVRQSTAPRRRLSASTP